MDYDPSNYPSQPAVESSGRSRRSHSRRRTPAAHRVLDGITEALLFAMLVFAPWAFGATQTWAIWTLTLTAYVLGACWLGKLLVRWIKDYQPPSWNDALSNQPQRKRWNNILTCLLAVITIFLLGWILLTALNPRATYYPGTYQFEYHDDFIPWLPHTYHTFATWFEFWKWLGLALVFWATRDWLITKTRSERRGDQELDPHAPESVLRTTSHGASQTRKSSGTTWADPSQSESRGETSSGSPSGNLRLQGVPQRMRRLLWVLCLNAAVLALISIGQRLEGTDKLLWLVKPRYGAADFHFGPYAYRSNAAQYFNLIWPLCLGFWWVLRNRYTARHHITHRTGGGPHVTLLPLAVLIGACPTVSTSRGGALVSYLALPFVFGLLWWDSRRRRGRHGWILIVLLLALLGAGLYLGWEPLAKRLSRLENIEKDASSMARLRQYENTWKMINDYPKFGVGPGAYGSLYQFYVGPEDEWTPYGHNDWQQAIAEYGWIGVPLWWLALLAILAAPWVRGARPRVFVGILYVALGTALLHAMFDFPFLIYSILLTAVVLMVLLLTVPPAERQMVG